MKAFSFACSAAVASAASASPYSFITFGDWGTGSTLQKDGASAVNRFCATPGACAQVIGLADNFYNGPLTTEDPRWRTDFQEMYNFCKLCTRVGLRRSPCPLTSPAPSPAPPLCSTCSCGLSHVLWQPRLVPKCSRGSASAGSRAHPFHSFPPPLSLLARQTTAAPSWRRTPSAPTVSGAREPALLCSRAP